MMILIGFVMYIDVEIYRTITYTMEEKGYDLNGCKLSVFYLMRYSNN